MYSANRAWTLTNTASRSSVLPKHQAATPASTQSLVLLPNLPTRHVSIRKPRYATSRAFSCLNKQAHGQCDITSRHSFAKLLSAGTQTMKWHPLSNDSRLAHPRLYSSIIESDQTSTEAAISADKTLEDVHARIVKAAMENDFDKVTAELNAIRDAHGTIPTETLEAVLEAYGTQRKADQPLAPMLTLYKNMIALGAKPTSAAYYHLIRTLCKRDMEVNRISRMLRRQVERSRTSLRNLPDLELERNMEKAMAFFDKAVEEQCTEAFDIHLYNDLLRVHAGNGNTRDGIYVFEQLERAKNVHPDGTTFAMLISMFGSAGDLKAVSECFKEYLVLQRHMKPHNYAYVYHALVYAHVNAGDISGALDIVEKVMVQNAIRVSIVPYNRILLGALQENNMELASQLLQKLKTDPWLPKPDANTYGILLTTYSKMKDVAKADEAYRHILEFDVSGQFGHFADYIAMCRDIEMPEKALNVAKTMSQRGLALDTIICNDVIKAFIIKNDLVATADAITTLFQLHARSYIVSYQSGLVATALRFLRKSDNLSASLSVLSMLHKHSIRVKIPAASAVIDTYMESKQDVDLWKKVSADFDAQTYTILYDTLNRTMADPETYITRAMMLLDDMRSLNIQPSSDIYGRVASKLAKYDLPEITAKWDREFEPFLSAVQDWAKQGDIQPKEEHSETSQITGTTEPDLQDPKIVNVSWNGDLEEDMLLLQKITVQQGNVPAMDDVNAIIKNARMAGRLDMVKSICDLVSNSIHTLDKSKQDEAFHGLYNSTLIAYARCDDMYMANVYYNELRKRGLFPSADAYAAMLSSTESSASDDANKILAFYKEAMENNVKPNTYFFNVILSKFAKSDKNDYIFDVIGDMEKLAIRPNSVTYGALISAFLRRGMESRATQTFKDMLDAPIRPKRISPFNNMIQYQLHKRNDKEKALDYYQLSKQHKVKPSAHTFRLLIEAHANFPPYDLPAAHRVLSDMERYGWKPRPVHYATLIRSYGCLHRDLDSAKAVYTSMENAGVLPNDSVLQALKDAEEMNKTEE